VARIGGYARRFWQGSHDHRGTEEKPGRVVTLIEMQHALCTGMAYRLHEAVLSETFRHLDDREKNGYARETECFSFDNGNSVSGLVYIATEDNFAYMGEASPEQLAEIIATSRGRSGSNSEYLFQLASALRRFNVDEPHVFDLETRVRTLLEH
jgi:cation transport protein ChaC